MAERTVSVKLSANVSSYLAAMASAKAATTGLSTGAARDFTQLGGAMQSVGRTATLGVTVPLLALGAGAVAMSAKFDTAFAQMVGLANVPAAEVDNLKESVLALAGETAVAPQELAEGLYFAASAGLDAAAAMDAVELAAKASAAGMGTTQDVVGLVASAVASYGEANISAAEATDILASTIREGRAEPAELAATLGRVLPIASQMGITFAEVGGATAYLTNIMGGADISTTALRDAFVKLSAPGAAAKNILVEMGTSFAELQSAIAEDGLLGALTLLREHGFDGNAEALHALVPDIQGYTALSALLADESGTLTQTLTDVANSAGSLDTAFSAVSETGGFKMKQAMTDIKVAMIQVGDILLPIAANVASSISGMIGWFTDLNPAVQGAVVAFAGLMTAAGPLTFIAGSLMKNWTSLAAVFGVSEGAASKVGRALGAMSLVAAGAYAAWQILGEGHLNASAHIDTASTALATETVAAYVAASAAGEATTAVDALAIAHVALSEAIAASADDELSEAMNRLNVTSDEWLDTLLRLEDAQYGSADAQRIFSEAMNFTAGEAAAYFYAIAQGVTDTEELARVTGRSVEEIEAVQEAFNTAQQYALENKEEINDLALTYLDLQSSMPGVASETLAVAESIAGSRVEAGNAVDVYREYVKQLLLLPPAERDAALGSDEMQAALAALPPELRALVDPTQEAGEAFEELATVQASSIDTMSDYQSYLADVDHILGEYAAGLDAALGSSRDFLRAHLDNADALADFGDNIEDASAGLDTNTDAGRDNANAVLDMADALIAMTQTNIESGKSQEDVNAEYLLGRQALLDAAEAAGLSREATDDLITTYGAVPELVTTSFELGNMALQQWRIDRYIEKLGDVDPEVATAIEVAIDAGDWAEANRLLGLLSQPRTTTLSIITVRHESRGSGPLQGGYAEGGYIRRPEVASIHGDEVVLPLSKPARMASLLGMSEVGPRVAAAFGGGGGGSSGSMSGSMSSPMSAASTASGGGDTYITNQVAVNMPPGSDGDDVVRALKQWQRRSGPLPLAVR